MSPEEPSSRATAHPVTLQDIAQRCQTTKATVSRALNHNPTLNAQTASRICAVAAEMGYDPARSHQARQMAARRHGRRILNHQIALTLPAYFHTTRYHSAIFEGIMNTLTPEGYEISLSMTPERGSGSPFSLPHSLIRGEVDGIILVGGDIDNMVFPQLNSLSYFTEGKCPLVLLINPVDQYPVIQTDDEAGGYALAHHLLSLGHRHLLYVFDGNEHDSFQRKLRGMHRAIDDVCGPGGPTIGIICLPEAPLLPHDLMLDRLAAISPDDHPIVRWLRTHQEYTAILAQYDLIAQHIWYLLRQVGWRVPEDFSLTGYDDTNPILDATGTTNLLTSVHLPLREVGQRAAELLIQQINGDTVPETRIMLPTTLMARTTTAAPNFRLIYD